MTLTGTHRFITPDDEALALALDLGNIGYRTTREVRCML
jgi:hypothetical protein